MERTVRSCGLTVLFAFFSGQRFAQFCYPLILKVHDNRNVIVRSGLEEEQVPAFSYVERLEDTPCPGEILGEDPHVLVVSHKDLEVPARQSKAGLSIVHQPKRERLQRAQDSLLREPRGLVCDHGLTLVNLEDRHAIRVHEIG